MRLSEAEVRERLKGLPGWTYAGGRIEKRYPFRAFTDGLAFVNRVAAIAEALDHHPDVLLQYGSVTLMCTTHSEKGVTEKDFELAARCELALAEA